MGKIVERPGGMFTFDKDGQIHNVDIEEVTYLVDDDTGARVELSRQYVKADTATVAALAGSDAANALAEIQRINELFVTERQKEAAALAAVSKADGP